MYLFNFQLKGLRQEIEIRMKNSVKQGQTVSPEVLNLHVLHRISNFFAGTSHRNCKLDLMTGRKNDQR